MRVITFSRVFPKGHPKAGQPTHFVEKMVRWYLLNDTPITLPSDFIDDFYLKRLTGLEPVAEFSPKQHTIRAGKRFKEGDLFSARVWSSKPYASKQIEILPPIKIHRIWKIKIQITGGVYKFWINGRLQYSTMIKDLARNDGLLIPDFLNWFNVHPKMKKQIFTGQILCWNPNLNYLHRQTNK